MKALANFNCNKRAKNKGEVLSDEDLAVFGDQLEGLIANGLVEDDGFVDVKVPPKEVETLGEQPEPKPKKGKKKKEEV